MNRLLVDSGIEWIGKIPDYWKITKLKYLYDNTIAGEVIDKSYWNTGEELLYTCQQTPMKSNFSDFPERKRTKENDLLLTRNATPYIFIPKMNSIYSNVVQKISIKKNTNKEYLRYALMSGVENLKVNGDTIPSWNMGVWNNIEIPLIPYEEQKKIANYLDIKCSKIDYVIENNNKEIQLLNELRDSIISEKVTSGLNKKVEFKKTNVDWCPIIPINWKTINPKGLFRQRKEKARENDIQLTASQKEGIITQEEYMQITGNKVVQVEKNFDILKHVEPDDFVISMRSFQGGLEYSNISGCISSAYVMLIPNKNKIYPDFYKWFFKSSKYINALQSTSNFIRDGQAMRYSNFEQIYLFDIPLAEQKAIAEYLNNKVRKIDEVIEYRKNIIEKLEEYKKSLIYEVVTGKKEV